MTTHIADNIMDVRSRIAAAAARAGRPAGQVTLVAVTKTRGADEIALAIEAGAVDLGENRVQELCEKLPIFAKQPVRWHLIGHLQRNKVKYVVGNTCLIHSVDSLRLAEEIEFRAAAADVTVDILIQVSPAAETQKSGVAPAECEALALEIAGKCPHIRVLGLMAVMPIADDPESLRPLFRETRMLFEQIAAKHGGGVGAKALVDVVDAKGAEPAPDANGCARGAQGSGGALPAFAHLSMGMTDDFEIAVEEGATIVRVGSGIFGPRA